MKVILLKDVPGTGRRHDVKEVAPGFASNFLLPNKLCVAATAEAIKKLEKEKAQADAESKVAESLVIKNLEALSGKTITLKEKANDEGHLFAGVKKDEVRKTLKKQLHIDLPEEYILLEKPIKEMGTHVIEAEGYNKKISFTIEITRA